MEIQENKVRNALVANRSVLKLFLTELNPTMLKDNVQCTELNPTILKIFHVSQSVMDALSDGLTNGLQELLELLFATKNI